jgi:hypothetical protein
MPFRRLERRLGEIDADLTLSVPGMAVKFEIFTQLAAGERPNGAERVPAPGKVPRAPGWRFGWRRPRGRPGRPGWRGWLGRPVYLSH